MPNATASHIKKVYFFGSENTDGSGTLRETLGGKGANLAEMSRLGIPVPPGFTIITDICNEYYDSNESLTNDLVEEVKENISKVENALNLTFGDASNPLLFSVRSGARVSMPGMMDTILNLGLNDISVEGLAKGSNSEAFAWDSYRRFIHMFATVVLDLDHHVFEKLIAEKRAQQGVETDNELSVDNLKALVAEYKAYLDREGKSFPQDPMEQLLLAIGAVFKSWRSQRAYKYRRINNISDDWGTAVNVQSMVFGNMGDTSGTGVAFTRNPSTGENAFYGEFLMNAQGEDVVAGIRTPQPIVELKNAFPEAYTHLETVYQKLETHFSDMQDLEFTIQDKKLYLLQTRNGKRTAAAALQIAVDMVNEGLITKEEAIRRIDPNQIDQLLHPMIDPNASLTAIAKGLPASPGAAVGEICFNPDDAEQKAANGVKVILVREETSPEDIGGMHAAEGILTARGGMTSHAAVVARGMGKCCVAGCGAIEINDATKTMSVGSIQLKEGDYLSLNGTTGEVIEGKVPLIQAKLTVAFNIVMGWADDIRTLNVRANAETPLDAKVAREFGAEGIGLCRTEHMFFEAERIKAVREMILSNDVEGRQRALAKIEPMQRGDFEQLFRTMVGLPVTIRLLDPPLHEFLPQDQKTMQELASELNCSLEDIQKKVNSLHEFNPMLGHRGCRLAITYPEIAEMQTRAIISAALNLAKEGISVIPEIMIPLIAFETEFSALKERVTAVANELIQSAGVALDYSVGTMIEIPRAALTADQIAAQADFFSFGTNDLTQMALGVSRDDSGTFLPEYVEKGLIPTDPFQSIDVLGVGSLVKIGIEKGRSVKPNLKIGICGEHGGDPESIAFCYNAGFDYVSCSPYRVPIARLAAAQATLNKKG